MIRPDLSEPPHVDTQGVGADVFVFPASFEQRRLWFLDRLIPDSYVYNLPTAYRITGRLNLSVLEETFSEIVSRHESLRTTFDAENGEPVQIISNPQPVRLPVIDLRSLEIGEREKQVRQLIKEELEYKFDLARGPLLRVTLLRTADEEHVLVKNMHHIISDSWSEDILLREWLSLYETFSQNKPPALATPAIQYADYTEWQKQTLQGEELERHLGYWKKKLGGEMSTLLLPTDHPRPAVIDFSGASASFVLSKKTAEALKVLSREQGVTLFITLLTAFKVLLYRYTSQTDIIVGVPITNRNRSELEDLIGFFLNTLVLRTEFQGNLGFREILGRVREVALGAFEHQNLPFEVLVENLQPQRDLTQHPLYQVMFVLMREEARLWKSNGLTIEPVKIEYTTAKLDLMLQMVEKANAIEGTFIYSTALFDRETIDRMMLHFQILLEGIVADPARSIDELPLLSEQERKQILIEWNKTQAPCSMMQVHELVAAQCERTPDATAVTFEGAQLSYRELNNRANHLAHELQRRGVGPEILVAICVERSLEMVIGLLAVLKAGGAYVPLDPGYPQERLAFMLSDAKAPVLLAQSHLSSRLPQHSADVIFLDQFEGETSKNPVSGVNAENLAYVIYTSGSTGKPKGAMNTHRGICNRLLWMQDAYGLTGMDNVLQKTPFTFDVSVWEFFWPLMFGARLVVARPGLHGDSGYLINTICEQKITTLHFVPPMLSAFLTDKGVGKCISLKRVICSGEALAVETQQQFFAALPGTELHNLYGPTEAAVDVTFWKCESDFSGSTVPIGRPVANTQIYLLNSALKPMPVGVAGELHIGGVQLARGYLARPELTAEKFIPNPFGEGRLYKTGDLARYRKDGAIEFLGRIDHQVKVRGFRIELAEIESALGRHLGVQQCVVIAREDRLVAYIVKRGETEEGDLRVFLKSKLPDYMIPSEFVFLDGLPLTSNGKVDRKALPTLEPSLSRQHEFVAPRTDLEKKLAAIWSHVLRVE
ncbi:MAG: amino acid adenylation domain-containing protein, partial [Chthoniobacteraceae bacterium]